jgi:hypothetical protein
MLSSFTVLIGSIERFVASSLQLCYGSVSLLSKIELAFIFSLQSNHILSYFCYSLFNLLSSFTLSLGVIKSCGTFLPSF